MAEGNILAPMATFMREVGTKACDMGEVSPHLPEGLSMRGTSSMIMPAGRSSQSGRANVL